MNKMIYFEYFNLNLKPFGNMKRILLSALISVTCTLLSEASSSYLFTYKADRINQELAKLQLIEDYIKSNPGVTPLRVQSNFSFLIDLNPDYNMVSNFGEKENDQLMGIPPFLWGLCLSVPGILIVYMMTEDNTQVKGAVWGCLVNGLTLSIGAVVYIYLIYTRFTSFFYW
jgi:hypothetical protein